MDKKKKMLLVFPILLLPFTALFFWALGGGKAVAAAGSEQIVKGLNADLPIPNNKDEQTDKMSFYDLARRDSTERLQAERMDPYARATAGMEQSSVNPYAQNPTDEELQVRSKMNEIERLINEKPAPKKSLTNEVHYDPLPLNTHESITSPEKDPEIEQLSQVMEKILDVQYPERIKTKTTTPVNAPQPADDYFGNDSVQTKSFYSAEDINDNNACAAMTEETKTIAPGAVIKIRLLQDLALPQVLIPKNNYVYGITSLQGDRLQLRVPSVAFNNSVYEVNLTAYDLQGLEGIPVPVSVVLQSARESAGESVASADMIALDPSLKAQAATAGINTIKNIFSHKTKAVRITVKAGYRLLLRSKQ